MATRRFRKARPGALTHFSKNALKQSRLAAQVPKIIRPQIAARQLNELLAEFRKKRPDLFGLPDEEAIRRFPNFFGQSRKK